MGHSFSEESITPPGLHLPGIIEELHCHLKLANALVSTCVVVEQLWTERKLFKTVPDVVHAVLDVARGLHPFLRKRQPKPVVLEILKVSAGLEIK
jgi:hypothetical protein